MISRDFFYLQLEKLQYKQLKHFKKKAASKESPLSFNNFYPTPKALLETKSPADKVVGQANIRKYGFPSWYEWRIHHWGVKWDVDAQFVDEAPTFLEYIFDTAWGPALPWMGKVSGDFPDLIFELEYDEPGMCFKGFAVAHNGEFSDECTDYEDDDYGEDEDDDSDE